jgi:hypothetical protein
MTLGDVFDVPNEFGLDGYTLMQALSFQGGPTRTRSQDPSAYGGGGRTQRRPPDVDYPMTATEIISAVNSKLLGTRSDMLGLKNTLDKNNNLGCP